MAAATNLGARSSGSNLGAGGSSGANLGAGGSSVAIIGAGSAGLTVLKGLREAGVAAVCFERGSRVGGNWVFDNDNQQSRIYRSLRINTSRDRMQFSDFPMPAEYPDYAGHQQIARYFEAYAEHFQLGPSIRFRRLVTRVAPEADGYTVESIPQGGGGRSRGVWGGRSQGGWGGSPNPNREGADGEAFDHGGSGDEEPDGELVREHFDAVIVANGHHWDPAYPEPALPGKFDGVVMHSHDYVDPDQPYALRGKRVVVVGIGNSAVDIASELAQAGAQVRLSVRRGAWVLPRYVFGKPIDQPGIIPERFSDSLKTSLAELWYRLRIGPPAAYGLPAPDHRLGHAHPTLSDELLPLLREGKILARPALERLEGDGVRFSDGSRERADALLYCTGYKVSFPFFDPSFVAAPNNELPLYLRCFHLEHPRLMFAGLCQPLGAIMPLVEAQGRLFAGYLTGKYQLPERSEMQRRTSLEREHVRRRFVATRRHTMQVDFDRYLADLERELRAGTNRYPQQHQQGAGEPGRI